VADRLERLTNLLALLLDTPEPLTLDRITHELAGQYPEDLSARRTAFERDKALLRAEGVPIDVVPQADGGSAYRVDRSRYELPNLELTEEERRALQLAAAAVHVGAASTEEALWKLGAEGVDGGAGPIATITSLELLPELFDAIAARSTVTFGYRGEERTVDPWGLAASEGWWYLIGRDHARDARRTFRVDRIDGAVRRGADGAFSAPAGFEASQGLPEDAKQWGEGEAQVAHVLVAPLRAAAVLRELGESAALRREDDGSVVVAVAVRNREAFRSWVLAMLEHAEVLHPPDLRDDVVSWLEAVVAAGGGA
jgi:proteasome accessory factor B